MDYFGYRFLLMVLIIAGNAFFAAAEVALLSVRQSRLKTMAEEGVVGAHAALNLLANPERLLSVVQVGVTLASLGLGWAGEEALYTALVALLQPFETPVTQAVLHGVSFVFAFLIMTYAHVVLGEVVPKNIAIDSADRLAVIVAPALLLFYKVSEPFVFVIERSAAAMSRALGVEGRTRGGGHSAEELKYIIASSRIEGHLLESVEDAIGRLIDLQDISTRQIMVPRNDIVSLEVNSPLDAVLRTMTDTQYSRVPVYEGKPENIIGFIHYKDLLPVWEERRRSNERRRPVPQFQLRKLIHKPLVVPESKPASQLIDDFRKSHKHLALVVDEFGTIVGLVTFEDVLEQVFGEIEDEYDVRRPLPAPEAEVLELEGSTSIQDLKTQYGIELPTEAGFETLAGFLLFRLGYIPVAGESVQEGDLRFVILEMDRNRIARVRIERLQIPKLPE
ncbi:MAG: HlyC/CorC family transporter [Bryobacteraceae bacterium]|nr:HlyC/CorC family transporter [Bryobacteraceae bacterium]